MLFTWDTQNLCVVFRWWHVRGPWSLLFTLIAVVLLGMSYEGLRHVARKFDESTAGTIRLECSSDPDDSGRRSPPLATGKYTPSRNTLERLYASETVCFVRVYVLIGRLGRRRHIIRALFYGLQVFYSYLLMLVAMTYQVISLESGLGLMIGTCAYCCWNWCCVGVLFFP